MSNEPRPVLEPVPFAAIAGWTADDHGAALAAFRRSCGEILGEARSHLRPARYGGSREQWTALCRKAETAGDALAFFENNLEAFRVYDAERPEGLFTGYFEPEAAGSRTRSAHFSVPVYGQPGDIVKFDPATEARLGVRYGRMVAGKPEPYFTRHQIDEGALSGRNLEIAWVADAADLFFMQVQGSGRLRLEDGSLLRLAYAGKSGLAYTAIGGVLVARGAFPPERNSMQAIRAWMRDHPDEARPLMWQNQSYVFFREVVVTDPALGPPGAQGVSLTPQRSLAVDRTLWQFGTPVWLSAQVPSGGGGTAESFRHLLIAQDTGSAIRGLARGDVFWGTGELAAQTAGLMKARGLMIVLLPKGFAPP